jgi:hypothetical protein
VANSGKAAASLLREALAPQYGDGSRRADHRPRRQPLDPDDGHPVEVEQQRRIVAQARGSCVIVLRREQK